MAYSEDLAQRVRDALIGCGEAPQERKMFGGLCFMIQGHMCCGIVKEELMVRVGPERYEEALAKKGGRPMDFTGRPLKGMVYVGKEGFRGVKALGQWVDLGLAFVHSLPPK